MTFKLENKNGMVREADVFTNILIKGKLLEFDNEGKLKGPVSNKTIKILGTTTGGRAFEQKYETDDNGEFEIRMSEELKNVTLAYYEGSKKYFHIMILGKGPNGIKTIFDTKKNNNYEGIIIPVLDDNTFYTNIQEDSYKNFEKYLIDNLKDYENVIDEFNEFLFNAVRLRIKDLEIDGATKIFNGVIDTPTDVYWNPFLDNIITIYKSKNLEERKKFLKYFWHFIIGIRYLPYNPSMPPAIFSFKENVKSKDDYDKHFSAVKKNYNKLKGLKLI
jgi:hypothetical protein